MQEMEKTLCRWVVLSAIIALLCVGNASAVEFYQISASQAKALIDENRSNAEFVILDVRTPKEYARVHIAGAVLLDYHNPGFRNGLQQLDRTKTYFIYCHSGYRSGRTLELIKKMGFGKVYHLRRGIIEWYRAKLPLVKPST